MWASEMEDGERGDNEEGAGCEQEDGSSARGQIQFSKTFLAL